MKKNKLPIVTELKLEPKKTLDQIWGIPDTNYKQKNVVEYKEFIRDMNDADLRAHCISLQLPFYPDRTLNMETLVNEFNKHKFHLRIFPGAN